MSLPDVWTAEPGTKRLVRIPVPPGAEGISAWVIAGNRRGPKVLVCACIHGDEYEGPRALQELARALEPEELQGTLVLAPVVNEGAMYAGKRCHPGDGKDLARTFPGRADGSVTERIAFTFRTRLLAGADYFVDLHSASSEFRIRPLAGYQMREGAVQEVQRRMAIAFGVDFVWGTPGLPGRTLSSAGEMNIPAIYVEMPGEGRCRPEDVAFVRRGVLQVLAAVGMRDGTYPADAPAWFVETRETGEGYLQGGHRVTSAGLFFPEVELWQPVEAGQPLGKVYGPAGEILCTVPAEGPGRVVYLRTFPPVAAGDSVAAIAKIPSSTSSESEAGNA